MNLNYEQMKEFMLDYCKDYTQYANDAESMRYMDKYWTPGFKVTAYFRRQDGAYPIVYPNRKQFQEFLVMTHQVIKDAMEIRDIVIDEKTKKVVLLLKIIKTNIQTKEKIEIDGVGSYQLFLDEDDKIKIRSLDFFWEAPREIKNLGMKKQ